MNANATPGPFGLVDSFATSEGRFQAITSLVALGAEALPAVRNGLKSANWQVRRWCAIVLDHVADSESLTDLIPLLRDPKSKVRLWAIHALACDHCKHDVECPIDVVPLLIERLEVDETIRVRRMATIMLATEFIDRRAVPVLQRLLCDEADRKLLFHAEAGLRRLKEAGMVVEGS